MPVLNRAIPIGLLIAFSAGSTGCSESASSMNAADKEQLREGKKTPGPAVGDEAKDFELTALSGERVKLSDVAKQGPVALVVLRGFPGYQCPLCSRQVQEFLTKSDEFRSAKTTILFVYPGPADQLKEKAAEFVKGKDYPKHVHFLLDPDYTFTKQYGLRWDARAETAYPSTFVIDSKQKITFAKVSTTHGDRAAVGDVLAAIPK